MSPQLADVRVPKRDPRFSSLTLDSLLEGVFSWAKKTPDAPALVESRRFGTNTLSYRELVRRIEAVESALVANGFASGDRVVYAVRPGIDSMVLLAALLRAGGSVCAVDPGMSRELFARRMELVRPSWVVAESVIFSASSDGMLGAMARRAGLALPDLAALGGRVVRVGPWLPGVPTGALAYSTLCDWTPTARPPVSLAADRVVLTIFTSGTTSEPKGVQHSARTLGAGCGIVADLVALTPGDVVLSQQTHQMLAALVAGATCVVPPASLDPARFVADVARHRVTHTYAVPFEMAKVVAHLERAGKRLPPHLRTIVLGSAPIQRPFLRRLREVIAPDADVWCAYAMTEMLPVAIVESREKLAWDDEGDLVGWPVTGARARVDEGHELHVTGPNLQRSYLGRDPSEWHATGDLARIDDEGRIVLLGRKKDMIIRGHHNVYPSLYEDRIASIEGVSRCAFVGLDTCDAADERIVLVVEPKAGLAAEAVRAAVERALREGTCAIDAYALPDRVMAFELPFSGRSNKLDRPKLRELVIARGGVDAV